MTYMLTAKPIITNKFWIVEKDGHQYATIQKSPSGIAFVQGDQREHFTTIGRLSEKHKIVFDKKEKVAARKEKTIYGFPCEGTPHNALFNLSKRVPVYTKINASSCFYCAGHYLVKYGAKSFIHEFCPKLLTVNRYETIGPFKTKEEAITHLNQLKN